jgi:hypothetical protein
MEGSMEREEEEEEKGEAIRGFELWADMRSYPNKELVARSFSPGFELAQKMSRQAKTSELRVNAPASPPWVELGPRNFSGRVLSLAIHPTNPNIMFAGSASGGLWRTTTGGTGAPGGINWTFVPTGFPLLGVASIAINPNDGDEIYVGSGEVYNSSALAGGSTGAGHIRLFRGSYGIGILKSVDGGVTWTKTLDFGASSIKGVMDLAIHPTTPSTVFAATTDGVYRTTNSGATWTLIHNVVLANSLEFKPGDPNTLYVGSGNFGTAGNGIYRSTNANAATPTFTKLTSGLPATITGKIYLAVTPANPNMVYASIGDNPDAPMPTTDGLYRSINDGASWTAMRVGANSIIGSQGWYSHAVGVSNTNANLTIWGELNTFRSTNGGSTHTQTGTWSLWNVNNTTIGTLMEGVNDNYVHADVHRIICSPHDATGNTFFLCTDGGVFRTTDGGQNFQTLNGGLNTTQIYANMAISPVNPNYMLLGLQDNEAMVYSGSPASRRIGNLGDGFHAAIKSNGVVQIVESYYFNRRRSTNSGATFGAGSGAVPELACFNVPMVYSRQAGSATMFAGTIFFKRSTDDGATWTNLNGGAAISGANNPIITMDAPTNSIVYFSTAPGGAIRSRLWRTTNGGTSFTEITGTLPDRYYSDIAVDPTDPNRIAVSLSGFGSSHVYLSTNGGTSWTNIGVGLPDVPANTVAFDPGSPGTLYVGNDIGVFYAHGVPVGPVGPSYSLAWTSYNEGFTDAIMVSDLLITSTGRIRLGSYGRGLWERDLAPAGTLPVQLVSITALRKNDANEVRWQTAEEFNVDRYEVEYSTDGNTFTRVGTVLSKSSSPTGHSYSYEHVVSQAAAAFYRLRIVDKDGSVEYSKVVRLNAKPSQQKIQLYPNPTRTVTNIRLFASTAQEVQIRVVDNIGRTVLTSRRNLVAGDQTIPVDLGSLPEGRYQVILKGQDIQWSGPVMKTK